MRHASDPKRLLFIVGETSPRPEEECREKARLSRSKGVVEVDEEILPGPGCPANKPRSSPCEDLDLVCPE